MSKDQIVLDHQVKKNEVLQFAQWSISMVKNSGKGPDCLESTILKITGKSGPSLVLKHTSISFDSLKESY